MLSNSQIVQRFIAGKPGVNRSMSSNGDSLFSYNLLLATRTRGRITAYDYRYPYSGVTSARMSPTTQGHVQTLFLYLPASARVVRPPDVHITRERAIIVIDNARKKSKREADKARRERIKAERETLHPPTYGADTQWSGTRIEL